MNSETTKPEAQVEPASIVHILPIESPVLPPTTAQDTESSAAPSRFHNPVDARGLALGILATVAFLYALHWAKDFLIPLLFGVFISYTLNPLVVWLERKKIPRAAGSSLVMILILCAAAFLTNNLRSEFQSILEGLPDSTQKLSRALSQTRSGQPSAIQQMQTAATEIEKATSQAAGVAVPSRKVAPPPQTAFKVSEWLWAGSIGAMGFLGQVVVVIFLIYFFLLSGDTFKRKLVKLTGPSLSNKKITVHILDGINDSIQNYMFMLLVTNSMLAILMWIAFHWIGLENAGAWAVAAGLLHVIPYVGTLLVTVATGLTAFMQFGSASMALLVAGVSLGIAVVVGTFVTTWMTGRIAKMNLAAVFVGLLFWAWLWGIWGMLLGIPIIVIVKVISEHVEGWQPVAELLGE
ncbi:AI-2E family transporter [soil metagenome]